MTNRLGNSGEVQYVPYLGSISRTSTSHHAYLTDDMLGGLVEIPRRRRERNFAKLISNCLIRS